MRHFHRTQLPPDRVLELADAYFPTVPVGKVRGDARSRRYEGELGAVTLRVGPEGGHYTRIEVETDQVGESRLDRNVKRYFVIVRRSADPRHGLRAAY
jgi:hypothetical protein